MVSAPRSPSPTPAPIFPKGKQPFQVSTAKRLFCMQDPKREGRGCCTAGRPTWTNSAIEGPISGYHLLHVQGFNDEAKRRLINKHDKALKSFSLHCCFPYKRCSRKGWLGDRWEVVGWRRPPIPHLPSHSRPSGWVAVVGAMLGG